MMSPAGPDARTIADVTWYLIIVSAIVVAVVTAAVVATWLRARRRTSAWSDPPGPDGDDDATARSVRWLGAYVPAAILVVTFGVAVGTVIATDDEGDAPVTIDVVGRQWFWDVTYPGEGVRTANELHVPVGQRVLLRVTSADVIHSFWVPSLDRKIDLIPGHTNTLEIEATTAGRYEGRCAEFCGEQHAVMRFRVIAVSPETFNTWAQAHQQPVGPSFQPAGGANIGAGDPKRGEAAFLNVKNQCITCHAIAGYKEAVGITGPNLTYFGNRETIAAGARPNTPENLAAWIRDPNAIKSGNQMAARIGVEPGKVRISDQDIADIVAFLESQTIAIQKPQPR